MTQTNTKNQWVLITGASGGIGLELSKLFAADGYNLVLVARRKEKLERIASDFQQTHKIQALVLALDLSAPQAAESIQKTLQKKSIAIDILVNNAGFGTHNTFIKGDLKQELNMLQLNVVSLTHLTGLLLPGMVKRGTGKILNVASTASFQPTPFMAVYGASKSYILHFSEALAEELKGSGITVTALCPGTTTTGFQERAKVGNVRLLNGNIMSAESVAKIGYQALMRGRRVIVSGFMNQLLAFSTRFMPRALVTRVSAYMMS